MVVSNDYNTGDELPAADVNDIVSLLYKSGGMGDGTDGSKTVSSSENLNPTNVFNYTDLTVDASQTLGVSSNNTPLVIRIEGNMTLNGILDLDENGGPASTDGASRLNSGTYVSAGVDGGVGEEGGSWAGSGGGGGGGNMIGTGSAGQDGSPVGGGTAGSGGGGGAPQVALNILSTLGIGIACGSGGGDGGEVGDATGGTGGAGGGAALIVVGGDLTLGASSQITADGGAGGNGTNGTNNATGGGGGGGGGGHVLIVVQGSITDSGVTLSAAGGAAGSGGSNAGNGAAGATGKIVIISMEDGTIVQS